MSHNEQSDRFADDRSQKTFFAQFQSTTRNRRFRRSSKNSPCPICNRTKDADCGWQDSVVLCHSFIDRDAGVLGYVYRGATNCGTWGQYFLQSEPEAKPIRPKATREFLYPDINGRSLVKVKRVDMGEGEKKFAQQHWDNMQWVAGLPDAVKRELHLYRIADPITQDAIRLGQPVLIVEGETKVDLLLSMGIAATCCIGGAGKWQKYGYPNYLKDLEGANVVLCPDRDLPGMDHCLDINQDFPDAQWLYPFPDSPFWTNLPKKHGVDIFDWISDYKLTSEQVLAAIGSKREFGESEEPHRQAGKQSNLDLLLSVASEARYFHTPERTSYVEVPIDEHWEILSLRSDEFKHWLSHRLYTQHRKVASSEAFNSCLGVLEGRAKFEAEAQSVYFRLAGHDGKIYLDLGTPDWAVVEISCEGWQVVRDCPVKFRRSSSMLPLPIPVLGGSIEELAQILNLNSSDWILVLSWLSFCFQPDYPHPILILSGEQGSGKSGASRLLKELIDPSKAPLSSEPKELRDLAINAHNRWVLGFDNLSGISNRLSDVLCRVATGAGFCTRTLHKNDEETFFEFMRPILINGIDDLATRSDLLERSILVTLPTIPETRRLTEDDLQTKLQTIKPGVLGALLTTVSKILKELPCVQPKALPRMADFARWSIALERALGFESGSFLQAYSQNRQKASEIALEASPIAVALQRLMEFRGDWYGSATELMAELGHLADGQLPKKHTWAASSRSLGRTLRRIAPDLRAIGIEVVQGKTGGQRFISIENVRQETPLKPQTP